MLDLAVAALERFHAKINQPPLRGMPSTPLKDAQGIHNVVKEMHNAARFADKMMHMSGRVDQRWHRIQLWLEECAEKLEACMKGDALECLDGICDSIYVDIGAAHRFNMDISGAFAEVCRSNDSKEFNGDPRVRDKGKNYSPPNLLPFVQKVK